MATLGQQQYRGHGLWPILENKLDELQKIDTEGRQDWSDARELVVEVLSDAYRAAKYPAGAPYIPILDALVTIVQSIGSNAAAVHQFQTGNGFNTLCSHVRVLPASPVRQASKAFEDALDRATDAAMRRLDELEDSVSGRQEALAAVESSTEALAAEVEAIKQRAIAAETKIEAAAQAADARLEAALSAQLKAWEATRSDRDTEYSEKAVEQLVFLAQAVDTGKKLVTAGAGNYTATEWSAREKQERRAAALFRGGTIVVGSAAALALTVFIIAAIESDQELSWSASLLRLGLSVVLGGIATFLAYESRRHMREANTAREIVTAVTALTPLLAESDESVRTSKREALADAVLVENVRSRLARRDASKDSGLKPDELQQLVDVLATASRLGGNKG